MCARYDNGEGPERIKVTITGAEYYLLRRASGNLAFDLVYALLSLSDLTKEQKVEAASFLYFQVSRCVLQVALRDYARHLYVNKGRR